MPQETYNLLSLDEDFDEEHGPDTRYAPFENMLSAAQLVTSLLLDGKEFTSTGVYAILGGFAMQLRGGRPSTRDIDVVTAMSMKRVWQVVTGVDRLVIPDSRLVESVVKVFVKTGSGYDLCKESHRIEVDINQKGFMGSPRDLTHKTDIVGPYKVGEESTSFHVLNISSMIKIKVGCCLSREEDRDFRDVAFMIGAHTKEVRKALEDEVVDQDDLCEVLGHQKMMPHDPKKLADMLEIQVETDA